MNLIEWKAEVERLAVMYGAACACRDASAISSAYADLIAHLNTDPDVTNVAAREREELRP